MLAATVITLGLLNIQGNISIAKSNKQSVKWYRDDYSACRELGSSEAVT